MKKLLIVESPAKIKTIGKFLGKDFKIMSTVGHIKDLPKKKTGITVDKDGIEIEYVVIEDKDKVIADICKAAGNAEAIYLAPDPDREGEIIAWHIGQEIEKVAKNKDAIHRITFNEITKSAITDAIKHPSHVDIEKVSAQQARRVLDRWVGYEVSPVLWQKIAKGLSAGRVQSVALKLIVDRHDEIVSFKPQEYWSIEGLFGHNKTTLNAPLTHINKKKIDIKDKKTADKIVKEIKAENYHVESITDKERSKKPMAPFMTSSLQQAAYNRLGFNVKKTMQIAQKLYEGIPLDDKQTPIALITYMRTDSLRLSDTALKDSRAYITKKFGKEYLPTKAHEYAKKGKAQDAHEAIRPISVDITPEFVKKYVSRDEARLYELIWKRAVACQMKPAVYAQRQVVIEGGKFSFRVTGSTLLFDGFLKVYAADEDEKEQKVVIPKTLKEKDKLDLKEVNPKQHFTQPPARFTEASLVKEMESNGIGRPSTYATILNTIRARQYTELDERKRFVPTQLGITVVKMLEENLPNIMSTDFTARMEEQLDAIAQGEVDRDKILKEFYKAFSEALVKFKGSKTEKHVEKIGKKCPECKEGELLIRTGKAGEFVGCSGYPECKFTSNFKRNEDNSVELVKIEGPKLLDDVCPKCKKNKLREMTGRFGPFISCSGYPKCKYIHQEKAGFTCPKDKGDVVKKIWKGNTMWGCGNYPKCKFAVFADIVETPCPKCKLPFLAKKIDKAGNEQIYCSDTACGYKA